MSWFAYWLFVYIFLFWCLVLSESTWNKCIGNLEAELPAQQFNTWVRPLRVEDVPSGNVLKLVAPNRFVLDWVNDKYRVRIEELISSIGGAVDTLELCVAQQRSAHGFSHPVSNQQSTGRTPETANLIKHENSQHFGQDSNSVVAPNSNVYHGDASLGSGPEGQNKPAFAPHVQSSSNTGKNINTSSNGTFNSKVKLGEEQALAHASPNSFQASPAADSTPIVNLHKSSLNANFVFDNFVVGKSNQLGLAAATQVAENPGGSYNPLFIYGGVGLGKTHLMHAVGNALCQRKPNARVVYLHSERFVADMVKALQLNAINDFKRYYRSVDALLIDDIQFFANKERSQEEFFHTFNALLEGNQQIILTCDRYPKEINGLEERLMSRFGWGLTVAIEPPELETRVAILMRKAQQVGEPLPDDAAFFIAQRIRSNVRELEGALKRVIANAHFTGREVSVALVREALKDLLVLQDRLVSIDNIQKVVAEYYKIKIGDLHSKRRSRSVARPRQVAMYLSKDLTNHSLPEIGEAFGGRDHTTVLHACRKIKEMSESDADIREDVKNLLRTLTT